MDRFLSSDVREIQALVLLVLEVREGFQRFLLEISKTKSLEFGRQK